MRCTHDHRHLVGAAIFLSLSQFVASVPVPTTEPPNRSQPRLISEDVDRFLQDGCDHQRTSVVELLLKPLGFSNTHNVVVVSTQNGPMEQSHGHVHDDTCTRLYPRYERRSVPDPVGELCALYFSTLKEACALNSDRGSNIDPTKIIAPRAKVSIEEVCATLSKWVKGRSAQDQSAKLYGDDCHQTCASVTKGGILLNITNEDCYGLYQGRKLLEALKAPISETASETAASSTDAIKDGASDTQQAGKSSSAPSSAATAAASSATSTPTAAPPATSTTALAGDSSTTSAIKGDANAGVSARLGNDATPDKNAALKPQVSQDGQESDEDDAKATIAKQDDGGDTRTGGAAVSGPSGVAPGSAKVIPGSAEVSSGSGVTSSPAPPVAGDNMPPPPPAAASPSPAPARQSGSVGSAAENGGPAVATGPDGTAAGQGHPAPHPESSAPAPAASVPAQVQPSGAGQVPEDAAAQQSEQSAGQHQQPPPAQRPDQTSAGAEQSQPQQQPEETAAASGAGDAPKMAPSSAAAAGEAGETDGPASAAEKTPTSAEKTPTSAEKTPALTEKAPVLTENLPALDENLPASAEKPPTPEKDAEVAAGGGAVQEAPPSRPTISAPPAPVGDPDYLDGVETDARAPADGDDEDFSISDPQPVYKAPSGVRPMDQQPGLGPYVGGALPAEGGDSNFFAYFLTAVVLCVVLYLAFHNKQKILALVIEGRGSTGRRRPHSSQYRRLDNSLEEAISSQQRREVASSIVY